METQDHYLTIESRVSGLYKDKGSKFFSFAWPIQSEDEAKAIVEQTRKEYHDARHVCFAYRLGLQGEVYRANDDGEPSGTAGKPILGQLLSAGVTGVLVVVVRYFGGTLLGVGGLIQAYREAARDALQRSILVEKTVDDTIELNFSYERVNDVMRILKEENISPVEQTFGLDCRLAVSVRKSQSRKVRDKFGKLENVKVIFAGK